MAKHLSVNKTTLEKEIWIGEEKYSNLPKGWKLERIGNVLLTVQSGFACSKKHEISDGIPHLRPNNIVFWGKLDLSKLVRVPRKMVDLQKYGLKRGDVLFNNTNSKELVGRAVLVQEDLGYGFSNHITRLRVSESLVSTQWLTAALNFLWLRGYFLKHCRKWIGQAGVNTTMLKMVEIPLPPLEEQRRIVARIEELVKKVEGAKKLRKQAKEEAERIMPAALHKVFSRAEVESWELVKLRDILKLANGEFITKKQLRSEREKPYTIPVYGSNGVIGYTVKASVNYDSLTIGRVGACGAVNSAEAPCWISDNAIYVKEINSNKVSLYFLYWLLKNCDLEKFVKKVAQPSISQRPILNMEVFLPPIEKQNEIVAYLNKIKEATKSLKKLQQKTEEELENLVPAIFDRAFRGEL